MGGESGVSGEVTQSGAGPIILVGTQPGGSRGGVHSSKFSLKTVPMHGVGEGVADDAGLTVVSSVSVLFPRLNCGEEVVQVAVFVSVPAAVGVTTKVTVALSWPGEPESSPKRQVMVVVPKQLP